MTLTPQKYKMNLISQIMQVPGIVSGGGVKSQLPQGIS